MKILLIEDDKFFRDFYAFKLKEKGLEVDVANDGIEGLQKISAFRPDLILLDLIMPQKDGFEVLQSMSEQGLTSVIPVLVFSTLGQDKDVARAKQLGARDYVNKSFFDFDKLFARIMELSQSSSQNVESPKSSSV
jgi:DNA-binding response OmpR family regulator